LLLRFEGEEEKWRGEEVAAEKRVCLGARRRRGEGRRDMMIKDGEGWRGKGKVMMSFFFPLGFVSWVLEV